MTDRPDYSEIIRRLEGASGPDRELDALICRAVTPSEWERFRNWASMPCGAPADIVDRDAVRWVPTYTASVDGSLALVGEGLAGWFWKMGCNPLCKVNDRYWFEVQCPAREIYREASGNTPPLAVLLALFRALESGA